MSSLHSFLIPEGIYSSFSESMPYNTTKQNKYGFEISVKSHIQKVCDDTDFYFLWDQDFISNLKIKV